MDSGTIGVLIVLIIAVALVCIGTIAVLILRDRSQERARATLAEQHRRDDERLGQLEQRLERMESQLTEVLALLKSVG